MEINFKETLPKIVWGSMDCKNSHNKYIYYLHDFKKICQNKMDEFYNMAKRHYQFNDLSFYIYDESTATYFLRDILKKINIPKDEICYIFDPKVDYNIYTVNCHLENAKQNIKINILKYKDSIKLDVVHHNTHYKYNVNEYTENNDNNLELYNILNDNINMSERFVNYDIYDEKIVIRPGFVHHNNINKRDFNIYYLSLIVFDKNAIKLHNNQKFNELLIGLEPLKYKLIDTLKQLKNIFEEENINLANFNAVNQYDKDYSSSLTLEYICFREGKLHIAKIKDGDDIYKINDDGTWEYISPTLNVKLGNATNYILGEDWNMQVLENEIQNIRPFLNLDFEEKGITKKLKN